MRDKEDSRCDKNRCPRGVQTAPASVSCLRKNLGGFFIASMHKTPTACMWGQECSHTLWVLSQQGGDNRAGAAAPCSSPSSQVMGANPSELAYSSQAAQVSAAKSIMGEFARNSGLWASPWSSITQTSHLFLCQYFTFPSNPWVCRPL